MSPILEVSTTVPSAAEAESIAQKLIELQVAACVQIHGPITSFYRWEGAVHRSEEWKLLIKSNINMKERLELTVAKLHPYSVPEILVVECQASNPYATWVDSNVK